jgi:hypothetical protein
MCIYTFLDEERKLTFLRDARRQKEQENLRLSSVIQELRDADDNTAMELLKRLRQDSNASRPLSPQKGNDVSARALHEPLTSATSSSVEMPSLNLSFDPNVSYRDVVNGIRDSSIEESYELVHLLKSGKDTHYLSNLISTGSVLGPLVLNEDENVSSIERELSCSTLGTSAKLGRDYTPYTTEALSSAEVDDNQREAQVWERTMHDQDHIAHLLSLYFSWQHSLFECFPEITFLDDMRTESGTFHSPLLLNAVCATASLVSNQGNAHDQCLEYAETALDLLPKVRYSGLSTIAALSLLSHVEESRGRLSSMWHLSGRGMRMCLDMQLHLQQKESSATTEQKGMPTIRVFWGSFISDVIASFTLARLPSIPITAITVNLPQIDEAEDVRPWYPSHLVGPGKLGARSSTFNRLAALAKLINSTLHLFFAPTKRMSAVILAQEYDKYLEWLRTLPPHVSKVENATPHVLSLHMQYHAAVLLLFRPFLFVHLPDIDTRSICKAAATAISEAFQIHQQLYEEFGICTFQVHCLLTACTIYIVNIEEDASLHNLIAACDHFKSLAGKIKWAAASLQIIKGLIEKWQIPISTALQAALYPTASDLPIYHFIPGEADSFLHYGYISNNPSVTVGDSHDQYPGSSFFSPFPDQPVPLLSPVGNSFFQGVSDVNNDSIQYTQSASDVDIASEDWLGRFLRNES